MINCQVLSFIGTSGSGKTTLLTQLIPLFVDLGKRVGTLKHTSHNHEFDQPGKDSWKHRQAGAEQTLLLSENGLALFKKPEPDDLKLNQVVEKWFPDYDLLLVEGFKNEGGFKVEIYRPENGKPPLYSRPEFEVDALVTNALPPFPIPHFHFDEMQRLVNWLVENIKNNKNSNQE